MPKVYGSDSLQEVSSACEMCALRYFILSGADAKVIILITLAISLIICSLDMVQPEALYISSKPSDFFLPALQIQFWFRKQFQQILYFHI